MSVMATGDQQPENISLKISVFHLLKCARCREEPGNEKNLSVARAKHPSTYLLESGASNRFSCDVGKKDQLSSPAGFSGAGAS